MDIDLGGEVKPSFTKDLFDWFTRNGMERFLKLRGKAPANKGRRKHTYKYRAIQDHILEGCNIGIALPHGVVVLDIDTREDKDGFAALGKLLEAAYPPEGRPSIDDLIKSTFVVRSGGGGLHLYFSHDPSQMARGSLRDYKGVDIKASNAGYLVAPGSVHPDTGKAYTVENQPEELAPLPEQLAAFVLEGIRDPLEKKALKSSPHPLWGVATAAGLGKLLGPLDPYRFRTYMGDNKAWLNLLTASHHATAGDLESMAVFADWSARDHKFERTAHTEVDKRWSGFQQRRNEGQPVATINTIFSAVSSAGREAARLGERTQLHADAEAEVKALRHKIEAAELEVLAEGGEAANLRAYIEALPKGWCSQTPSKLYELASKISDLPDDVWPELSHVLSVSSGGEHSPLQIERLIKKKANKRKKEETKEKLTQAEIVDTAARRALKIIAPNELDLLKPPKASFYIYRDGYWQPFHEELVYKACFDVLDEYLDKSIQGLKPLPYYTREASHQISYMTGTESTLLYDRQEMPSCVNLINGTLWFKKDGTYTLEPHRREDFLTTRLPYVYDSEAQCPSMITMLTQVFGNVLRDYGEAEVMELIRHFFEFVGYILQPKKDIPLMMFWLGEGRNGKSTIANIISKLLDPKAVFNADLASHLDPSNKHGTASLEGKLLAIDEDVGENAEISDRIFKKICQSKQYEINPKNKDSRQIMLQTIVLFLANNGVKVVDTSPGFSRRTYVMEFSNIEHLQSSALPDRVELLEMPGVLNEAVKGLSRLRKRGFFDVPKCAQDFKARFLIDSNSVLGFWESLDKRESEQGQTRVQDLYNSYCLYMTSGNFGKASSRKSFVKALQRQKITITGEYLIGWDITITV